MLLLKSVKHSEFLLFFVCEICFHFFPEKMYPFLVPSILKFYWYGLDISLFLDIFRTFSGTFQSRNLHCSVLGNSIILLKNFSCFSPFLKDFSCCWFFFLNFSDVKICISCLGFFFKSISLLVSHFLYVLLLLSGKIPQFNHIGI